MDSINCRIVSASFLSLDRKYKQVNKAMNIILTTSILAFLCIVALTAMVHAQDQSGFINIDCGIPENAEYTDDTTHINYVSDTSFVDTGVSHEISSAYHKEGLLRQYRNLRSFSEGIRNCYTLKPPGAYVRFLIRAIFMYGDYDGLSRLPSFKITLEADVWDSVEFEDSETPVTLEIIHKPQREYIHVCLVNTNFGTPFISALELRPLSNLTYITQSGSLSRFWHMNVGSTTDKEFRYPADIYDRIWLPKEFDNWAPISSLNDVDSTTTNFQPPSVVVQSAVIPANGSSYLWFSWEPVDPTSKYYVYMYFSEFESEQTPRMMNIYKNGDHWHGPFSPSYLSTTTIYSPAPLMNEKNYVFSIRTTKSSTQSPVLNALELYEVKEFPQLLTNPEDVEAITNVKSKYEVKRSNWQGDPCAPKVHLWQGLDCSYDANQPPRIISLNLSSSGIAGEITSQIFRFTSIESLDLSNNNLTGPVPGFLAELQNLRVLNLSENNLEGSLPAGLIEKSKNGPLSLSVDGNPNLYLSDSCKGKKKNNKFIVPVLASVVSFTILVAALAILWNLRRRKQVEKQEGSLELKNRKFSYSDVVRMTNNLERVLGKGGFGTVYHGYLDDNQVAVKMLSLSSVQGYKQFHAEVELLIRAHHKNLTILVGYCNEGINMALIYEFMAKGNLRAHILDDGADILSWEERLRIATESAQGLDYLHSGCKPLIVHRDVKSTNILLNEKLEAKLSDFGLSKIIPVEGGNHVSTTVVGTPGYLDPEYHNSNRLTEKSDVYSFGVVLLELITGERAMIQNTRERTHISRWVSFMLAKGDIRRIVDQRLQGDFDISTVWKAVEIAMACIAPISTKRPTMNQVVVELSDCLAMEIARTNAHHNTSIGYGELMMMDLNMHSEVLPLAR